MGAHQRDTKYNIIALKDAQKFQKHASTHLNLRVNIA